MTRRRIVTLVVLEKAGDTVVVVVIGVRWHQYNTRTQCEIAERFKIDPDRVVLALQPLHVAQSASAAQGCRYPYASRHFHP